MHSALTTGTSSSKLNKGLNFVYFRAPADFAREADRGGLEEWFKVDGLTRRRELAEEIAALAREQHEPEGPLSHVEMVQLPDLRFQVTSVSLRSDKETITS